ncbi:MAG: head completion/stabilization protein [Caulobacter sp.]|nr:head completion/stabilization protein [Caulobacter sp.]
MTGFVTLPPPSADPPAPAPPATITNEPWFPAIQLETVRLIGRIDSAVTAERLAEATTAAMLLVNKDLAAWRALREAEGATSLEAAPATTIAGQNRNVFLYRRAVAAFAKAELLEGYVDYDLTKAGEPAGEDRSPDVARRAGRHAVRDILGRARATVELI